MDIKNIFNLILLSLSVTTLVITLISYIIFRLRYSLQKKHSEDIHHLEGNFFRRFAPHLKEVNELNKKSLENKITKREIWRRRPVIIFIFIGIIITSLFAAENYFIYRRELTERVMTAKSYRKLLEGGLLKSNDYNPNESFKSGESFSLEFLERQKFLISALQTKQVQLYSPSENSNDPYHLQAIANWDLWLNRLNIKAVHSALCDELKTDELIIAPHLNSITNLNTECLLQLMKNGAAIIFTGTTGGGILQSEFSLKTITNKDLKQNYPTMFMSESNLAWDIPPGLLIPWYPLDNQNIFQNDLSNPIAFQAGFAGYRSSPNQKLAARIILNEDNIHRSLWSALDPPKDYLENQIYIDNILLSALAWTSKIPLSKIASWKNGTKSASVIAIDSEDKFINLEELAKIVKNSGHPLTAFLVSDIFLKNLNILKFTDSFDDIGSHTDNHENLKDYSSEQNFQRLQKSRLDIEENWQSKVSGFRPPEETYNDTELNIVKQSGYKYIFADQRPFRYSPVFVENNSLILFPRVMDDDVIIKRNRLLENPKQVSNYLFEQFETTQKFGGMYIFSLHTHIFGEDQVLRDGFKDFLERLKKEVVWKTTLRDLANWWQSRDGLITSISEKEGLTDHEITLTVHNRGQSEVLGAMVWLVSGKTGIESIFNSSTKSGETLSTKINCLDGNCQVRLPPIPAQTIVTFKFTSNK